MLDLAIMDAAALPVHDSFILHLGYAETGALWGPSVGHSTAVSKLKYL